MYDDLLGWAPASYVAFQVSKGTIPITDPEGFDDHVFLEVAAAKIHAAAEAHSRSNMCPPFGAASGLFPRAADCLSVGWVR